jgi:hypothetical protein
MCFVCLKNHFEQTDETLVIAYKCYNKQRVRRDYPRIFEILTCFPELNMHPTVCTFFEYMNNGRTLPPSLASEVLSILHVYNKDQMLRENYLWLITNRTLYDDAEYLLTKHSGKHGVWPTIDERETVYNWRLGIHEPVFSSDLLK